MGDETVWSIWIDSWTLQDWYDELVVGERAEFAVEFWQHAPLTIADPGTPTGAIQLTDDKYDVRALVTFLDERVSVVDFGLVAGYWGKPLASAMVGDVVSGQIGLKVADIVRSLAPRLPACPPLMHSWNVQRVQRETAPFVRASSKNEWEREGSRLVDIARTTRVDDHNSDGTGNGIEYRLECTLVAEPPRPLTSATDSAG